jgi:bleomycin hydrolase
MKPITTKTLDALEASYQTKPVQKALSRVLVSNELHTLFNKLESIPKTQFRFTKEIKTMPVTWQKQSGRCWLFAGLNLLREKIGAKYGMKTFELSQNHIAYYDKLEKINYFIESVDDFLDADSDDRTLQHILKTGIQDGGQWDMFVSLVEKYGVVPKDVMEETKSSSGTRFMNQLINIRLRKYAADARRIAKEGQKDAIPALKEKALDELHTFLSTNFGTPPARFDFEYVDKDDTYHVIKGLSPQDFYQKSFPNGLSDYVSVIHAPTKDKPYMKTYTVAYLGNVVGGRQIKYLNLPMDQLKSLVLDQLMADEPVWFGSDVGRYGDRTRGVWDDQSYDIEEMTGLDLSMTKAEELDYSQSAMNRERLK